MLLHCLLLLLLLLFVAAAIAVYCFAIVADVPVASTVAIAVFG